MCGICGVVDFQRPAGPARREQVRAATEALQHRGPDDQGFFDSPHASFGFRRLAVVDLPTGQQPVVDPATGAALVFNGEIYNFRELREALGGDAVFRSRGDAEVILRLYLEEGPRFLDRLNGMFALALFDPRRRVAFLARDRFGIKPLFYVRLGAGWAFASELRGLLAGGWIDASEPEPSQLFHYLHQGHLPPAGGWFPGVASVPPACVLELRPGGARLRRYWHPPDLPVERRPTFREAVEATDAALRRAVSRQRLADVPVGVFLSSGVDSGTLAALLAEVSEEPVRTFSVGFEGDGAADERPGAARTARALGARHHEIHLRAADVAADLPRIFESLDTPVGDPTCVPTWYLSRLARSEVVVALSGEGADELFGGYARQRYDAWLDALPRAARSAVPALLRALGRPVSPALCERLGMSPGPERQLHWSRIFRPEEIRSISPEAAEAGLGAPVPAFLGERWDAVAAQDPLNARLMLDREWFLPGDLLVKVDRMSMAHSLEVRVPYLDHDVADLVIPLPGGYKVRPGADKRLLRAVSRRVAPPGVGGRRKRGFHLPLDAWLRGPLGIWARDVLASRSAREGAWNAGAVAADLWRGLEERRPGAARRLWTLAALEGWRRSLPAARAAAAM